MMKFNMSQLSESFKLCRTTKALKITSHRSHIITIFNRKKAHIVAKHRQVHLPIH